MHIIDGVVDSLPGVTADKVYFLTTDSRIYFSVGSSWNSLSVELWDELTLRENGETFVYNGETLVSIGSHTEVSERLTSLEVKTDNLGSAAYKDSSYFATSNELDEKVDTLSNTQQQFVSDLSDTAAGAGLVAYSGTVIYPENTVGHFLNNGVNNTTDSADIVYKADGITTTETTVFDKFSHVVDLSDFLKMYGNGPYTHMQTLTACGLAWQQALATGKNLYAPAGLYEIGDASFPWRQQIVTALLDCKNITIYGDGPNTIFRTNSVNGADVFQLNGMKNIHIRDLCLQSKISGSGAGSNGISITNGYDNITINNVTAYNLASLDKGTYIDGGKALTVQCDASTLEVGRLFCKGLYAVGCAQGFGFEAGLVNFLNKKVNIDVEVTAENCYVGTVFVAGAATGALPAGTQSGVSVRCTAINCQKDLILNRAHGVNFDVKVITTTTSSRLLDPSGRVWFAADQAVISATVCYAKNSLIRVTGNKGVCIYKANIGGTTAGSSGLGGTTQYCDIYIDLAGAASNGAINDVLATDGVMKNCTFTYTSTTSASVPASFSLAANANTILKN